MGFTEMIIGNIDLLLRGLLVGLASSITVGPVAVLCIQRTLSKSRTSGFLSGMGVACADTLMAIIAFFFYALMQAQIEQYKSIISLLGGIFIVIVGVVIFFQNPAPQIRRNRTGVSSSWRDFASMFGFTMANFITVIPYILAFFAMFGVESHDGSRDLATIVSSLLVLIGFFGGAAEKSRDPAAGRLVVSAHAAHQPIPQPFPPSTYADDKPCGRYHYRIARCYNYTIDSSINKPKWNNQLRE